MSRLILVVSLICTSMVILADNFRAVDAREMQATRLPAQIIARHQRYPGCLTLSDPMMPRQGSAFYARLNRETEIYGILCEPSAYNWPYAVYIVRDGYKNDAERMFFADFNNSMGWTGTDLLFNASFDKKTGILQGFSKARGLGDCGSLTTLKWNGEEFSLVEFRYKEKCDGNIDKPFPVIYKHNKKRK